MWWSERKIEWYERASSQCSFHRELSAVIERYLKKGESVLELGCGLGHTAAVLSSTHPVTAIDIEGAPIKAAVEREGKNIYHVSDWREWKEKSDAVLCIFFGRLYDTERLSSLFSLASRHLVYVYSEHRGQSGSLVSRPVPTLSQMKTFLSSEGYTAESESFTIPFPQPLKSMEEAVEFIRVSYPGKNMDDYLRFVTGTDNDSYPYILKNDKKLVLFDIYRS